MNEITRERAEQLFKMMLFLRNTGKYLITRLEAKRMPHFENYQLRQNNVIVAELDYRGEKFYYAEF